MSLFPRALCLVLLATALPAAAQGFIENRGQWDAEVLYLAQTPGHAVWITHDGFVADLRSFEVPSVREAAGAMVRRRGNVVRVRVEGAAPAAPPEALRPLPGLRHYRLGEIAGHVTDVRSFAEVRVPASPGVAVRFTLTARGLRASVEGTAALTVEGAALAGVTGGTVEILGREGRQPLAEVAFVGPSGVRAADVRDQRLVPGGPWAEGTEPERLPSGDSVLWSTLLGAAGSDFTDELAVDPEGRSVVAGFTSSVEFPVTPGAYDESYNLQSDVFVARLSADGSALDYATYLGGNGIDVAYGLATNAAGQVLVVGETISPDFPRTGGVHASDESTAFAARFSPDGAILDYSLLVGGFNQDQPRAVLLDAEGKGFMAGKTASSNFPTTSLAFDRTYGGGEDAFFIGLGEGTFSFSTFLGGSGRETADALDFAPDGRVIVAGTTGSIDFPVTNGAYDPTFNGLQDAYVAWFSADGSALGAATYVGGSSPEVVWDIAVDADGRVVLGGETFSSDFPTTESAVDTTYNLGPGDGMVVVLSDEGSALDYSTLLGGPDIDVVHGVAFDAAGRIVASGATRSADFPAPMGELSGFDDAFVVRIAPAGFYLDGGMFLGAPDVDEARGLAITADGQILVGGATRSADFPTTPGAFSRTHGGSSDVFVTSLMLPTLVAREDAPVAGVEVSAVMPNPSRGSARLVVTLAEAGRVEVTVFDALGRRVASVPGTARPAGANEVALGLDGLAAGVYGVRASVQLSSGREAAATRRLVVAR